MGKPPSLPKIERKIIEKNRRTQMKTLYSKLISLLPNHSSKVEELSLPDQIEEAVEHIKSMQKKLEKLRQKKDELMLGQGKRTSDQSCVVDSSENQATKKGLSSPTIEVHDMGPNLDLVLANGIQDYSTFHDIIRLIHDQNGVEIPSASFGRDGGSTIQVLQDNKVGQSKLDLEGAIMSRKLKELVCGTCSTSEVVESDQFNHLWDYEIGSDIWGWGFEMPHVFAAETHFDYYDQFPNMSNFNM